MTSPVTVPGYALWIPVVAALGAAALTGLATVGITTMQHRRERKAAANKELAAAYGAMLSSCLNFAMQANLLRMVMQFRSGLAEGPSVALGLRPPFDAEALFDRIMRDFRPVNEAWSQLQTIGSQEAVDAASRVLDACADVLAAATARSQRRFARIVVGERWTPDQVSALDAAMQRLGDKRRALAVLSRQELGRAAIDLEFPLAAP